MRLLRARKSYRDIAQELHISVNTVRTLINRAYRILEVQSRKDLPEV